MTDEMHHPAGDPIPLAGEVADRPVPALARRLGLTPHPEGGWYRRTWTGTSSVAVTEVDGGAGTRPAASLIEFFLPAGEWSAWHVVAFDETWLWHGPDPLVLQLGGTGDQPEPGEQVRLGPDWLGGDVPHVVVPAGVWQRTLPGVGEALVSCLVSPGFTYADWRLADGLQAVAPLVDAPAVVVPEEVR